MLSQIYQAEQERIQKLITMGSGIFGMITPIAIFGAWIPSWNSSPSTRFRPWRTHRLVSLLLLALALGIAPNSYGQVPPPGCGGPQTIRNQLRVIDNPPIYSTSRGWQQGRVIATLPPGTTIYTCETKDVGFFSATERWVKIWWSGRTGWVHGANIDAAARAGRVIETSFVRAAFAQEGAEPPSPPGPPLNTGSFVAMLLGMLAKLIFEYSRSPFPLQPGLLLRQLLPPLVVSPIVFLGLINYIGIVLPSNGSLLMVYLFAFQNGFFWQDILAKVSSPADPPVLQGQTGHHH
jgi:hypothetical protein